MWVDVVNADSGINEPRAPHLGCVLWVGGRFGQQV